MWNFGKIEIKFTKAKDPSEASPSYKNFQNPKIEPNYQDEVIEPKYIVLLIFILSNYIFRNLLVSVLLSQFSLYFTSIILKFKR